MQLTDVLEEYFFLEVRLIIRFNDNQFITFWGFGRIFILNLS